MPAAGGKKIVRGKKMAVDKPTGVRPNKPKSSSIWNKLTSPPEKAVRNADVGSPNGPVTIYLNKERFKAFSQLCKSRGLSASNAIDELIADLLSDADLARHPKQ